MRERNEVRHAIERSFLVLWYDKLVAIFSESLVSCYTATDSM